MRRFFGAVLLLAASSAFGANFSAAEVPGTRLRQSGRIVIRNVGNTITAYRFSGSIRQALLILRSTRTLHTTPYGAVLFDASTRVTTPMPAELSSVIEEAGRMHIVDPRLVAAVAGRESAYDPRAVSRAGACGIMQLMPSTARYLGIGDVFDIRQNVFGATHYLRTLLDTFHGDLDLTLAAYNAGPGAVARYKGVPPFRETRQYVKAVRAAYEVALGR